MKLGSNVSEKNAAKLTAAAAVPTAKCQASRWAYQHNVKTTGKSLSLLYFLFPHLPSLGWSFRFQLNRSRQSLTDTPNWFSFSWLEIQSIWQPRLAVTDFLSSSFWHFHRNVSEPAVKLLVAYFQALRWQMFLKGKQDKNGEADPQHWDLHMETYLVILSHEPGLDGRGLVWENIQVPMQVVG